jgi:hypothetical protein
MVIIGCWFYLVDSNFTRAFCDVSIDSRLLFYTFKVLDTNPQLNFQLLLMFITLYDYKMSFNLLGLAEELEHLVKP